MMFLVIFCGLALTALFVINQAKRSASVTKDSDFQKLESEYLTVYYLATFSDWLQGPYVYKVYSDYGYNEEEIAILFIAGFASSSLFGAIVGHLADKYGRKTLCTLFGILYSICCLTKLSSSFYILLLGRILGGISTSILFSTFEAWYINEHTNHFNLPQEFLNITFSKASFSTGFLAIFAGIISQICVETLNLSSVSPFIIAIPFLLTCSFLVCTTWQEHSYHHGFSRISFLAPLHLIIFKDRTLLILGIIQSMFEAVMYTFIFSWTPIISDLNPPLGTVFASFMIAFMIGSKIYNILLSKRFPPQWILVLTSSLSFLSLGTVGATISYILHASEQDPLPSEKRILLIQICFVCFIMYEMVLGMYFPVMGYLKSQVVPEEHRASIANWFRVPMNIFTCISLTFNRINKNKQESPNSETVLKKFDLIYLLCSIFLLVTTVASIFFLQKYNRRYLRGELTESKEFLINKYGNNDSS